VVEREGLCALELCGDCSFCAQARLGEPDINRSMHFLSHKEQSTAALDREVKGGLCAKSSG
jgi:hypothetical protein